LIRDRIRYLRRHGAWHSGIAVTQRADGIATAGGHTLHIHPLALRGNRKQSGRRSLQSARACELRADVQAMAVRRPLCALRSVTPVLAARDVGAGDCDRVTRNNLSVLDGENIYARRCTLVAGRNNAHQRSVAAPRCRGVRDAVGRRRSRGTPATDPRLPPRIELRTGRGLRRLLRPGRRRSANADRYSSEDGRDLRVPDNVLATAHVRSCQYLKVRPIAVDRPERSMLSKPEKLSLNLPCAQMYFASPVSARWGVSVKSRPASPCTAGDQPDEFRSAEKTLLSFVSTKSPC